MAKWREAPEVREIAERLIPDYHRRIQLWADEIRYVFRDEAQKSKGRLVYGKSSIISGLSAYCVNNVAGADNDYGQAGPTDLDERCKSARDYLRSVGVQFSYGYDFTGEKLVTLAQLVREMIGGSE